MGKGRKFGDWGLFLEGWGTGPRIEEFREDGERRWSRTEMASCAPDQLNTNWERRGRGSWSLYTSLYLSWISMNIWPFCFPWSSVYIFMWHPLLCLLFTKIHFSEEKPLRGCLLTHKPALKGWFISGLTRFTVTAIASLHSQKAERWWEAYMPDLHARPEKARRGFL